MRISVERLRIGLLVGAGLLVVVIAAFLGYARYRIQRGIAGLPGRLGATITRESNGYTYSQSDGKKTVFTIHAAKAVQHADGKYTLHDVNMILYGHKGDRADRISGSEFEYDTKAEMIRATGLVHIDLAAPVAQGAAQSEASKHLGASGPGGGEEAGEGSRVIHVTTSGLTYVKSLATAATDQGLDFAFGGFTGHAVGAEYNSDSGHLVLQSAVTLAGLDKGKPVAMAASHGELDRASNQAEFSQARYSSAGEVARVETAHLHMRPDGSLERIEGVGQVVLENAGQGTVTSDRVDAALGKTNKLETALLTGNVKFNDDEAFRQTQGESQTADLRFDDEGRIQHAVLRGRAHTYERLRAAEDTRAPWSERTLTADTIELNLIANPETASAPGKAQLHDAKAMGAARLLTVSTVLAGTAGKKAGTTTDRLEGDELDAHFVELRGAVELSTVHGAGHTVLEQTVGESGAKSSVTQTSRGETLNARFREVAGSKGSVELAQAVQEGGVVIDRSAPAKGAAGYAPNTQHALASKASYDADTDKLTLMDGVRIDDPQSTLWAARVVMERGSGDALADGGVRVTYLQEGATEPVHVLAARAELNHDAGRAIFYGRALSGAPSGSGRARMWQAPTQTGSQQGTPSGGASHQGGSQIEAPVLVFEQNSKRLTARAEMPGVMGAVHTVLTSAKSQTPSGARANGLTKAAREPDSDTSAKQPKKTGPAVKKDSDQQMPVRITSSELVYSDESRQATFTGGVSLVDTDGEMRAQEATVFLTPADAKAQKTLAVTPKASRVGDGMLGGQVERIIATRHIELTQPGRLATGDRLVYTASDQMFVLTGTATTPPKVVDDEQGTTTGAMLQFHTGDDSVSVLGNDGTLAPRRVHTETHLETKVRKQ